MEEELLMGMIRDRETQIKLIETKLEDQKKKMERVQMDRVKVTELQQAQKVEQQRDIEVVLKQYKTVQRDYRESKDSLDMKKQQQQQSMSPASTSTSAPTGPGLHVYNEIMKSVAAPENNDSSYVLRMQAQLCKAMHSMGMMETQLQLTSAQQDQTQKAMKDVITDMVEEKSQVELKLMNELVVADTAKREVEVKVKEQSEAFIKEKDVLMEKIERQNDPENEEEQESDDEEEKEELQEILVQGREEIERLEAENKKQEATLEELKEQVAKTKGQDIVDEIVTSIAEEFKEREEEGGSDEDEDD